MHLDKTRIRIPLEKFTQYALDFERDKNKALAFQVELGYNKANVAALIANIYANIGEFQAVPKGDDGYGMRYEVIMTLIGANEKKATVLTAWIDDKDTGELRLISAYVDNPKGGNVDDKGI